VNEPRALQGQGLLDKMLEGGVTKALGQAGFDIFSGRKRQSDA
jgi:hypothetical protein